VRLITIAVDGPAASGKSTIGQLLAGELGYLYFDTGVMYRAVAWAALERGIPIEDEARVSQLARELEICVEPPTEDDGRQNTILADGVDITWQIREPAVNHAVSPVATYPGVRTALVAQQRRIGAQGGIVMVGRDIGTVVLPEAECKVYLDASLLVRAQRRHLEATRRGATRSLEEEIAEIRRRDEIDSSRATAPLTQAPDAFYLDTSELGIQEVVQRILVEVRRVAGGRDDGCC
jgi:cytidylate kinase